MLALVAALGGAPLEQPPRPNHRKADVPHHRKGGGNRPQPKADAPPRAAPVPASSAPIQHGQRKKHKAELVLPYPGGALAAHKQQKKGKREDPPPLAF